MQNFVYSSIIRASCRCFTANVRIVTRLSHHLGNDPSKIVDKRNGIEYLLEQIRKGNRVQLKTLRNVIPNIVHTEIEDNHINVLLNCCGKFLPNESFQNKHEMCRQVFEGLTKVTADICNTYIRICTENHIVLNYKEFLNKISHTELDSGTYKALLENVCEGGDVEQSKYILNDMKCKGMAVDEEDFNNLVLVHTIQSGLQGAEVVLQTMKAAQITESEATNLQIFKGLANRNNPNDFQTALKLHPLKMSETNLLEVLERVALNGNLEFLSQILKLFPTNHVSQENVLKVDYLCLSLIYANQSKSALIIYETLVPPVSDKRYGQFLLREMLIRREPIDFIIDTCKRFRDKHLNPYSLQNTAEIALRLKLFDDVLEFYDHFDDASMRPHFYWPLIINAHEREGEFGVVTVLSDMMQKRVKIDAETLYNYVIPKCNYRDLKSVVALLQNVGLTVKDILTPLLIVLLRENQVELAENACELYNVALHDDPLLKILGKSWVECRKSHGFVKILQKLCETNTKSTQIDYVGEFLIRSLKECRNDRDLDQFRLLIQIVVDKKLRITQNSFEILSNLIRIKSRNNKQIETQIKNSINHLLDLTIANTKDDFFPHPRNMSVEQLECHLEELKQKNMETRGVLRKLIQQHCSLGNFQRAQQYREEFLQKGYHESPGMKSSLMHTYALSGNLEGASKMFNELKSKHSNFKLDAFKVIDLAKLLVENDEEVEALKIIVDSVGKYNGSTPPIERNCWQLLNSYKNDIKQQEMFDYLIDNGFCKATNVILGPLVRLHLNKGDLEKSVDLFVDFAKKYKTTPLQLELLLATVRIKNSELTQRILEASGNVHGNTAAVSSLVTALAECGLQNPLKKLLTESVIAPSEFIKKYDRWVKEDKLDGLKTLEAVGRSLPRDLIDLDRVRLSILKILSLRNDCQSLLDYHKELVEQEQNISKEFELELMNCLVRCKCKIPDDLLMKNRNKSI